MSKLQLCKEAIIDVLYHNQPAESISDEYVRSGVKCILKSLARPELYYKKAVQMWFPYKQDLIKTLDEKKGMRQVSDLVHHIDHMIDEQAAFYSMFKENQ